VLAVEATAGIDLLGPLIVGVRVELQDRALRVVDLHNLGARGGDRVGEVLFEVIHHERIGSRQVEFLPLFRCALLADGAGGVFERYGDVGEVRIVDEYELYLVGRVVDRADDRLRTAGGRSRLHQGRKGVRGDEFREFSIGIAGGNHTGCKNDE
jgi:hypothetical protein